MPITPELPAVAPHLITSGAQFADALERVWALAGRFRFDEANAQLSAIVAAPDRGGPDLDSVAAAVCAYAKLHAFDADRSVYEWLKSRGINLWYAWNAGATSGGEGMARSVDVRQAEREFADIERDLGING